MQPGPVHLRDRGRRQRHGIEGREHLLGRTAEVLDQLRQQQFVRHGRRAVLQLAELGDPLGLEQVDPGRQHLAQLDEGRPEFLEHASQPLRRRQVDQLMTVAPVQRAAGILERIGQPEALDQVAEAVADQDRGDIVQAAQIADRGERLPQHQAPLPPALPLPA